MKRHNRNNTQTTEANGNLPKTFCASVSLRLCVKSSAPLPASQALSR